MRIVSVHLAVFLGLAVMGCSVSRFTKANHWQTKVDQVAVGMPRSEIENLLPRHNVSPGTTMIHGGSQATTYWVDEDWCVTIAYDYTGVPRDAKGTALATTSPQNKVISIPVLTKAMMPPSIEVETIDTIEQSPRGDSLKAATQSATPPAVATGMTLAETLDVKGKHYRAFLGPHTGRIALIYDDVTIHIAGGILPKYGRVTKVESTIPSIKEWVEATPYEDEKKENP